MKLRKIAAILVLLLLELSLSSAAFAAQFEAEMSPAQMQGAGDASLKLSITNDSDYDMEAITVSGLGYSYSIPGSIGPGETIHCPLSGIHISEDMLNQDLEFTVEWMQNGENKTKSIKTMVVFGSGAALEVSRTADRTQAPTGGQINLTYIIRNTGAATLEKISLVDKKVAGSTPLAKDISLLPGQQYELAHVFTMGNGYVTSAPVVTYTPEGAETPMTYTVAALDLMMINPKLDVTVTQGQTTPDGTVFTLDIENNGNQTISKISITDEKGNKVNEELFVLTIGEKRSLSYTVVTEETRNVRFTIKGVDGTKQPYEDTTKKYEVRPYIDPDLIGLSFGAFSVRALEPDGTMKVRFHLNNTGSVPMHNLAIQEIELGELKIIDELPIGESDFEMELNVGAPRPMVFTLDAVDPVGNPYTFTSNLNAEYLDIQTAPADTPFLPGSEEIGAKKTGSVSETLLTLLIVIAGLTLAAGIALAVLTQNERKIAGAHKKPAQSRAGANPASIARRVRPREDSLQERPRPAGNILQEKPIRQHTGSRMQERPVQQNIGSRMQRRPVQQSTESRMQGRPVQPYRAERPLQNPQSASYAQRTVSPEIRRENISCGPGASFAGKQRQVMDEVNKPIDGDFHSEGAPRQRPDPQLPFEIRSQPRHISPKEPD